MAYRVQTMRPAQVPEEHWQVTHATPLLALGGSSGRLPPPNITGLDQPFPLPHDWRGRAGFGVFPGPRAVHAKDYDHPNQRRLF